MSGLHKLQRKGWTYYHIYGHYQGIFGAKLRWVSGKCKIGGRFASTALTYGGTMGFPRAGIYQQHLHKRINSFSTKCQEKTTFCWFAGRPSWCIKRCTVMQQSWYIHSGLCTTTAAGILSPLDNGIIIIIIIIIIVIIIIIIIIFGPTDWPESLVPAFARPSWPRLGWNAATIRCCHRCWSGHCKWFHQLALGMPSWVPEKEP